jgi:hypothetical protein
VRGRSGPESAAEGREVHGNEMSPEAYRGLGFPGADDLGNMLAKNEHAIPLDA